MLVRMGSGENRAIACSIGAQQGDPMGRTNLIIVATVGLKRFRAEFEGEGVKALAFAYMGDVTLDLMVVTVTAVRALTFVRRELDGIGIVVNLAKRVTLTLKDFVQTVENVSFLANINVRIAADRDDVAITIIEYVTERVAGPVRRGSVHVVPRFLAGIPVKRPPSLPPNAMHRASAITPRACHGHGCALPSAWEGRQPGEAGHCCFVRLMLVMLTFVSGGKHVACATHNNNAARNSSRKLSYDGQCMHTWHVTWWL